MRILLVPAGPPSMAAARTRLYQYLPALRAAAIEAQVAPFYTQSALDFLAGEPWPRFASKVFSAARAAWLASIAASFDLVVWQRVLLPPALLWLVRRRSRRLVFDVDDALYASPSGESFDPRAAIRNARRFARIAAGSDAVIASTAAIARYARRFQPRTYQILSPVDTERFTPPTTRPPGPPVVGWIGSPATSCYLQPLLPILSDLLGRRAVRVMLVGADLVGLPREIEQRSWKLHREVEDLRCMDIGIMPLGSDEWSRAKGGYKALQYQASGAVCIASPVGAAVEIIQHGDNGLLAHEPGEWSAALIRLIDDTPFRYALALRARQTVQEHYSLHACAPKLIEILSTVAELPGRPVNC